MNRIETLASRTVYENRWIRVHEDRIRFPDGSEGLYGVVAKADFVLIVPVHDNGRFQMVRQYRYPTGGRFWEFPQGSWEARPDADPVLVAHGELEEETGFRAARLDRLGFLYPANGISNQGCHLFRAAGLTPGRRNLDPEEQDLETAAFARVEIEAMIAAGEIRDATTVAALHLLDRSS